MYSYARFNVKVLLAHLVSPTSRYSYDVFYKTQSLWCIVIRFNIALIIKRTLVNYFLASVLFSL